MVGEAGLTTGFRAFLEHVSLPVILKPEAFREWMQPGASPDDLKEIIDTQIHTDFAFHPVSKAVNSVKNNTADLIEAAIGRITEPTVRVDIAASHPVARARLFAARSLEDIEQLQSGNPNPLLDEYDAPFAARLRQARKNSKL